MDNVENTEQDLEKISKSAEVKGKAASKAKKRVVTGIPEQWSRQRQYGA